MENEYDYLHCESAWYLNSSVILFLIILAKFWDTLLIVLKVIFKPFHEWAGYVCCPYAVFCPFHAAYALLVIFITATLSFVLYIYTRCRMSKIVTKMQKTKQKQRRANPSVEHPKNR